MPRAAEPRTVPAAPRSTGRRAGTLLVALALAALIAGCGTSTGIGTSAGTREDPVRIGLLTALTGPSAEQGRAGQDWTQVMERELTAPGAPLEGRGVEVITYDTKSDPSTAANFARRLITRDGVAAISCCPSSSESLQVQAIASRFRVPVIGGALLPDLTDRATPGYGWYFRATPGQDTTTRQLVEYVAAQGYRRVALSYAAVDFGDLGRRQISEGLRERGVELVAATPIDITATDAVGQASELRAAEPDAVISWDYPATTAVMVRDLRAAGYDGPVVSNWSAHNDALFAVGGSGAANVEAHTVWDPEKPRSRELAAAYRRATGRTPPDGQQNNLEAQFMWLIGIAAANALQDGGELSGARLREGLLRIRDLPAEELMFGAAGSSVSFGRPYRSAGGQNPYDGTTLDSMLMERTRGEGWSILRDGR